jgi:hypothetical protein
MHAEVRFHQGEPHILEIAVRPGGGGLDYFARISAGYSPIEAMMEVARGRKPAVGHYQPTGVHTAGLCLISAPGRVEAINVPESVATSERVFFLKVTAKPGDVIKRPPHGNNILGFLCTTGTSLDDAMQVAGELAGQIEITMAAEGAPAAASQAPLVSAVPQKGGSLWHSLRTARPPPRAARSPGPATSASRRPPSSPSPRLSGSASGTCWSSRR